jgi:hypothetical protein
MELELLKVTSTTADHIAGWFKTNLLEFSGDVCGGLAFSPIAGSSPFEAVVCQPHDERL